MPVKHVKMYGLSMVLSCDGKCHKAWGINQRPMVFYMEEGQPPRELRQGEKPRDYEDFAWKADNELGDAPADLGSYEGGDGKPAVREMTQGNAALMNRWCARECERHVLDEEGVTPQVPPRDFSKRVPNFNKREQTA